MINRNVIWREIWIVQWDKYKLNLQNKYNLFNITNTNLYKLIMFNRNIQNEAEPIPNNEKY